MTTESTYDVAIVGGGLAGLSLSVQLAKKGYRVVLLEKEKYPFHKVCGEYISMESWPFLTALGIPLQQLDVPLITQLELTAPNGRVFQTKLPQGGFGISRYRLDELMAELAVQAGVKLLQQCRVDEVVTGDPFHIQYTHAGESGRVTARLCVHAYGKRSNLDVKWQRGFVTQPTARLDNYIAVKYHVQTRWPENRIGLHNFENGYCGISKVEGGAYCLCYLTTAANLRKSSHSIQQMEQDILSVNPALRHIFSNSNRDPGFPVTIAQVSFSKKTQSVNKMLMIGDAAGMITPLCGNGMSMALHSSKIAFELLHSQLQGKITLDEMLQQYQKQWSAAFGKRMAAGRALQYFFGKKMLSNVFVSLFKTFPGLAATTIRQTHGRPF